VQCLGYPSYEEGSCKYRMFREKCNMSLNGKMLLFISREGFVVHPLLSDMKEDEVVSLFSEYNLNVKKRKYLAKMVVL